MVKVQRRLASPAARQQIGRWVGKGFWAIMDQGFFAVSNFALNVLLARWLTPTDYGAFVTAFAVFLLLSGFHNSLIVEPMFVFGSGRHLTVFPAYLKRVVSYHWILSFVLSSCSLLLGVFFLYGWLIDSPSPSLASSFFAFAVAIPFILFYWLMRRTCYSQFKSQVAFGASASYCAVLLGALYFIQQVGWLSIGTALIAMALASSVAGCVAFASVIRSSSKSTEFIGAGIAKEHWDYGKWVIATSFASWIPGNLYYLVLPIVAGLEASGNLRALMLLVMPVTNFNIALASLITPKLVRVRGTSQFSKYVTSSVGVFAMTGIAYWLLLLLFGDEIMRLLYGDVYARHAGLLVVVGLIPVFSGSLNALTSALRSLERPDLEFRAYLASTAVAVTAGLILVLTFKLEGAAIGFVLTSATALVGASWLTKKVLVARP